MAAVANKFISNINQVYKQCAGFETYGETTEFFDESGCVLMIATREPDGKIQFKFADDNEPYDYKEAVGS